MNTTISKINDLKKNKQPIAMLTAYDFSMARLLDMAGIDMILVGDSLGNVVMGYDSTLPVTMEDMIHHVKAVSRACKQALVVGDMPFMSYQISVSEAVKNAGRLMQEGGAGAVKLEGGSKVLEQVKAIVSSGIPVMGHLGLTPQSVNQLGGFKVQGKTQQAAQKLLDEARALEEAGAFSLVLECVPAPLASAVSKALSIPTIGIGAGSGCDGQVLVINDLLGMDNSFKPKFVKRYADLQNLIGEAVGSYIADVRERKFPAAENSFTLADGILEKLY